MENNGIPSVLMADDDEEDCMLASDALKESGKEVEFACVEDGVHLMDYLLEHSGSWPNGLPDLILLDLNMPRKDGREALLEIMPNPVLKRIPIVILTTSKEERDIAFTMNAGAKSFITKPGTFNEWIEIMRSLVQTWLK